MPNNVVVGIELTTRSPLELATTGRFPVPANVEFLIVPTIWSSVDGLMVPMPKSS